MWRGPARWVLIPACRPTRSSSSPGGSPGPTRARHWSLSTLGGALFRAGKFDEAIARLDEARSVEPGWSGTPVIEVLRAMAIRAGTVEQPAPAVTRRPRVPMRTRRSTPPSSSIE